MKVDIQYLSTRQAALRLGVSLGTVQNMVESGVLSAWKTTGGHRRIPLAAVEAMLARRPAALSASFSGGNEGPRLDILVTEHDKAQQAVYQQSIDEWGLPVDLRLAGNGFDGLLEVGRQAPDILVTDLEMPGLDGCEMIRHLRANPHLERMDIIAVCPATSTGELAEQLPTGIALLRHPVSFDELKGFVLGRLASRQRAA